MPPLDEFALIQRFFTPDALPAHVALGVGDDCALLIVPPGNVLAVSVDTQVPGVHFPLDAEPFLLASRVLRCAASDLAAMGATPLGFTLALTLPVADEVWLAAFSRGLLEAATALGCPLVGGDTTRGPFSVTVQVQGAVPEGLALRRTGAQPGDEVWVSGTLGDGAAALALLENRLQVSSSTALFLRRRFYQPDIDFALGCALRGVATACIDVSDGLLADLGHILKASHVGAVIEVAHLPIADWRAAVDVAQARRWALSGGDDYRLCFTAPPGQRELLAAQPGLACVGHIVTSSGITLVDEHGVASLPDSSGYQHFSGVDHVV